MHVALEGVEESPDGEGNGLSETVHRVTDVLHTPNIPSEG
jgi:hypothetical protein